MNKCDYETKKILKKLLTEGCPDINPRPYYEDKYYKATKHYDAKDNLIELKTMNGEIIKINTDVQEIKEIDDTIIVHTPAHTYSYNHEMVTYDLSKGEFPLSTLRPTAIKSAIAEIIWIYVMQSSDLVIFDELLGKNTWNENHKINNWWEEWALRDNNGNYILNDAGHPHIGCCYGETIRRHNLIEKLLTGIKENPDGRRHIINMWQEDDFKNPHGLKPCAYQTVWNVRHTKKGDLLDMCLFQRSSDFCTAGVINQAQYAVLLLMVAAHTGYKPGKFTWFVDNIQCYDRHILQANEMLSREPIECRPFVKVLKNDFFNLTPDDIIVENYPIEEIKEKNPQLKFDIAI